MGPEILLLVSSRSPVQPSGLLLTRAREQRIADHMRLLDVHLGVFLGVHNGRNGDTEVRGRAPEVCIVEAMVSQYPRNISSHSNH
jgi:hypothetical protein